MDQRRVELKKCIYKMKVPGEHNINHVVSRLLIKRIRCKAAGRMIYFETMEDAVAAKLLL